MKRIIGLSVLFLLIFALPSLGAQGRLFHYPDVSGNLVAFVYAGDIWTVPLSGGEARRLTSHVGRELFPKISPDGKWIAFSGEYSGNRQIYVIPSEGGTPKQLTFYNDVGEMPTRGGFDNVVLDWTPDSRSIMIRANRTPWGERMGKYFLVNLEGGLEMPLAIPEAGMGHLSPDGHKVVYTPIERDFRNWKRYKGGRAQDVWIYDLDKNASDRITDFPGTDQQPLWIGEKIYFVSDRDLTLNLYTFDLKSRNIEQVTHFTDADILWPSGRVNKIVFEKAGEIYFLETETGKVAPLSISLHGDFPDTLPRFVKTDKFIQSSSLSPTGKRALFEARGDIYSLPEKDGPVVNLTDTQGVRELYPAWSPDGKWILYYSDKSGEYEIYLRDVSTGKVVALTEKSRIWRFPAQWSPDSSKVLFYDKNGLLQILDIHTKAVETVDKGDRQDLTEASWSPDSRWIVYTKEGASGQSALRLYSLESKKSQPLTDGTYQDSGAVFSPCGKYIYFLSQRDFNLSFSSYEFDYLFNKASRIYILPLTTDAPNPFPEKVDQESLSAASAAPLKAEAKGKSKAAPAKPSIRVDFTNISARIVTLPLPADDYVGLIASQEGLYYFKNGELHLYKFSEKKDETVLAGVQSCELSADEKKILYRAGSKWGILPATPGQKVGEGLLKTNEMEMRLEPRKEWLQIFDDGWRLFRDWFYVSNIHGLDWEKMRAKYRPLVEGIAHRADLDFLFHEMLGEVNVGHAYVNAGEYPEIPRIQNGLLGAALTPDTKAGRYRITKIYQGENWSEATRSPLQEAGVDVREGDYLISLCGHDVTLKDNPYSFLENKAGKRVEIGVNLSPTTQGVRLSTITPIPSEQSLFYLDWVRSRRAIVDKLSNGKIGYIHVPDTSMPGNIELFKGMYAYANKEALIIDDRYNGGGFIPSVMIDLVGRKVLNYWSRRNLNLSQEPGVAHTGPKAMLINHYSSSGGDAFPFFFRKRGLGTIIGTRTWGGLVGISGNPSFVDGGFFNVPSFGFVNTEGEWDVEGVGVAPDIEVWDRPEQIVQGKDPCIEKAVEVLLEELKKNPPKSVTTPKAPDRSKWIEREIK